MQDDAAALKKRYEPKEVTKIELDRQVCRVRFSPCGKYLLAGGYDALIRRWNVQTDEPKPLVPLKGHHGWVQNVAFHPEGEEVFSADSWGELRCWEYAGDNPKLRWRQETAHDGWIRALALSRDGQLLATSGRDRQVRVWFTDDGTLQQAFSGHEEEVYCVAFHPDGKSVVSGDLLGTVKHWSLESGKHVRDIDARAMHLYERIQDVGGLRVLDFDIEGKTLICAGSEPTRAGRTYGIPTLSLYDWESGKHRQSLHQGEAKDGYVFDMVWHPDGFFMFVTCGTPGQGKLQFRRIEDEKPFLVNDSMPNCHSLAVHPDGRRLLVAATNRRSQGNGRVTNKQGEYLGNSSPLYLLAFPETTA